MRSVLSVAACAFVFALQAGTYVSSADWVKQDDGSWRSGAIADDQASVLVNRALATKPGFVTFEWKSSSESDCDFLRFYVDGEPKGAISGAWSASWSAVRVAVYGEGAHTLEWVYSKDGSLSHGEDCGWIRNLSFSEGDFRLTLDAQGGELKNASVPAMDGEAIGKLPRPAYPGHAFLGWWTALEGGEKVTSETVFTSAATLYARWRESKYDYDGAEWTELEGGILKTPSIKGGETSSLITYVNGDGVLSFDARYSMEDGNMARGFTVYVDDKIAYNDVWGGSIPLSAEWSPAFKVAIAGAGRHIVKLERSMYGDDYDAPLPAGFVWVRGLNFAEADSWADAFVSDVPVIEGMEGTMESPVALKIFPDEEEGGEYNRCYGIAKWTAPKTGHVSFVMGDYHSYRNYAGVARIVGGVFKWTNSSLGWMRDGDSLYPCEFYKVEEGKTYYVMAWNLTYTFDDNVTCGLSWFEAPDFEIGVGDAGSVSCVGVPPAELVIPDGAMNIDESQFLDAPTVESVVIPASVTSVGNYAFGGCTNLATVTFKGDAPELGGYWEWDDDEEVDVWVAGGLSNSFWNCSASLTVRVPSFAAGWTVGTTTYECYDEYTDTYEEKEIKVEVIPDVNVTLDDGSGAITTNSVPENFKIADAFALPEPVKDGFVFQGWFTAAEGGDAVDGGYVVTGDMALFAHWADAVVAAIDAGAEGATIGDDTTNMVFAVGEKALAKLSALSGNRVGFVLTGWSVVAEGGNIPVDENTVVEAGMTFVAEWTEAVSVTFKKDEADAEPYAAVTLAKGASAGEMMPEDPYDDFVAEDGSCRIFGGWFTAIPTVNGVTTNSFDAATTVQEHTTALGDWCRAFQVVFDTDGYGEFFEVYNGGVREVLTKPVRIAQGHVLGELPEPDSVYYPYSFGGWRYEVQEEQYEEQTDGSVVTNLVTSAKTATPDTVVDKALHIYAWYNVDVRFDANGGTVGSKKLSLEVGKPFGELPVATRDGFEFGGWTYWKELEWYDFEWSASDNDWKDLYWDDDLGEVVTYSEKKVPVTADTVVSAEKRYLRASWKHVLTFDAGEGRFATGDANITTNCDEYAELTFPADPVRDGYMFAGWYDAEGNLVDESSWNVEREDEWGLVLPRTSALFARWYNFTVTFDAMGGEPEAVTNVYVAGETLGELPDATRDGFVLAGWFRGDEAISADTVVETNFAATAKWNKVIVFVDGGETNKLTVAEGEPVTLPVPDDREGFAFAGWFDADGNLVTELAATADVPSSLVAKWSVTVTFDAGAGDWEGTTSTSNVTIYADEPIGANMPEAPVRDGCEFEGWSDADGKDVTAETVVSASATFTARWSNVTVTFDAKGGDCDVDSRSYMVGELLGELPAATREGLVLAGWFRDVSDGGDPATITTVELSAGTVVDRSFEAYAKWNAVVAFVDGNVTNEQEVAENAEVALPADPEREGAAFAGWYYANGEKVTVDKVTASAAVSLKARWNVVVTFDAGEGSMAGDAGETNLVEKVLFDDEAVGELPVPVRDGYVLVGWFAETEGGEVEIGPDSVIASNTTVRAKWGFNVTFDAGDGAWPAFDELGFELPGTTVLVVAVGEGEAVGAKMPSDPVYANAMFGGWFTGEGEGKVAFTAESVVTTDVVVRAEWAEGLTVTFDANGGECGEEKRTIAKGSAIGELPEATLDGWSLIGWFTAKNGGDAVTPETTPEADAVYYAHWARGAVVTFDANGGTVEEAERVVKHGSAIGELPVPTLAGKAFLGWFTAAEGGDSIDDTFSPGANITVYAHWADSWKVTFDANGGTVEETEREVAKGQALGTLPVATRKGYQLVGWYTAKTKGKVVKATVKPTKNVTYYAIWKAASYKVTVFADGSGKATGGKSYAVGKKVALAAKPAKGWVFVGWDYLVADEDEVDGFWPAYEQQIRQPSVSFAMPACEVVVFAVFAKAKQDTTPGVSLDYEGPWHLASDGERVLGISVDSLTYAAATVALPAGLKKGMKLAKVPGTDDQWTLKVASLANCQPGVYKLTIKAKNRAGKTGTASIQVIAPNTTVAVDKGALSMSEELAKAADTEDPYELYVGMKFDWASLGVKAASGCKLASVSGLPTGLKWNAKTGKVTGICSKAGMFTATFAVKKGKTTYKASVTFNVKPLPAYAIGTFKGWTSASVDSAAGPDAASRAVTITASSAGKLSAKVGTYSFSCNGWSFGESGNLVAKLTGNRTVGKGKSAKKYEDTLEIALDDADWNVIQVAGTVKTVLSGTTEPMNEDVYVFAQRNAFADADNEEAAEIAAALADLKTVSLGVAEAPEDAGCQYGLVADGAAKVKVAVKADGTVTFFGVIGGKSVSASAVVEVDGDFNASARFFTASCVVEVTFSRDASGEYAYSNGRVWMK